MEDLAAALAAAIGSQNNAANTATSLQAALPSALFVRYAKQPSAERLRSAGLETAGAPDCLPPPPVARPPLCCAEPPCGAGMGSLLQTTFCEREAWS
jgi:hypothetical protein